MGGPAAKFTAKSSWWSPRVCRDDVRYFIGASTAIARALRKIHQNAVLVRQVVGRRGCDCLVVMLRLLLVPSAGVLRTPRTVGVRSTLVNRREGQRPSRRREARWFGNPTLCAGYLSAETGCCAPPWRSPTTPGSSP